MSRRVARLIGLVPFVLPAPSLWRDFVRVAFHVNYRDRLGWKDTLASPAFTARADAAAWDASSVYTRCFVRNGDE